MATNRQAARDHLASARNSDNEDAPVQAVMAVAFALLDVADAIREQTKAAEPGADIAKDYHAEAVEGIAEAVGDVNVTLEKICSEVADLRCVAAKAAGR